MQISSKRRAATAIVPVLLALWISGCAGSLSRTARSTYREEGLASWYGTDFYGRRTASGDRYDMYAMTAAHRTLPLGMEVFVTNRETDRRVKVRINDRGPFVAGRIIDLSYAAARKLGLADAGVAPVILEAFAAIPPPTAAATPGAAPAGFFSIQVGAFASAPNAERLRAQLVPEFPEVRVVTFEDNRGLWHRVRAGRFVTEAQAARTARNLEARGFTTFVVRED